MVGVDQRLIECFEMGLAISPIDFGIPEYGGARTTKDQQILFERGATKCDGIKIISFHQVKDEIHPHLPVLAEAMDFYAYVDGKASWEPEHLATVAAAILQAATVLEVNLEWGGLWPWDKPHIQLGARDRSPR